MKKVPLSLLAATLLCASAGLYAADELKPVVTVSFAGYDRLFGDLDTIGRIAGTPDVGKGLQMAIQLMTQGKGLAGLDTKQPWGAVLQTDGKQLIPAVAFLPITDLKQFVEVAKSQPQLSESIRGDGDVYEIRANRQTFYATQKGKWTIIADDREKLAKAPTDPLKLVGDLPQRYLVAVRASVPNVPKEFRDQILAQLRAGADVGMQQKGSESDEQYKLRQDMAKQVMQRLEALANEADEITLGWTVDAKTNSTYLDAEATALAGTKLAEQFATVKPGMTKLAGVMTPDAAVTFNSLGEPSDVQITQAKGVFAAMQEALPKELANKGASAEQVKLATQLVGEVVEVVEKTLESKKTDLAAALVLEPAKLTLVAGAAIVDGAKLEKTVEQLADQLKKNADEAKAVKLQSETYQTFHLHSLSMLTPEPAIVPLVGEHLDVVLGVADDKVFVAVGRDAAKTIKQAIDKSSTGAEVPPLQMRVSAKRVAKFIEQSGDDPQAKAVAQMVNKLLESSPNKDHLTLTAAPIPRGVRLRLELEEGLIKAIGAVGQSLSGMGRGGLSP